MDTNESQTLETKVVTFRLVDPSEESKGNWTILIGITNNQYTEQQWQADKAALATLLQLEDTRCCQIPIAMHNDQIDLVSLKEKIQTTLSEINSKRVQLLRIVIMGLVHHRVLFTSVTLLIQQWRAHQGGKSVLLVTNGDNIYRDFLEFVRLASLDNLCKEARYCNLGDIFQGPDFEIPYAHMLERNNVGSSFPFHQLTAREVRRLSIGLTAMLSVLCVFSFILGYLVSLSLL